ncbi:MAG: HEAT repeat domain-containing protein [Bacteroidota bacterium]
MKKIDEATLMDYLAGELPPDERALVSAELARNPALFTELEALETLLSELSTAPEPQVTAAMDERFAAMLEDAVTAAPVPAAQVRSLPVYHRPIFRRLAAAAAVLLIFTVGYNLGTNTQERELSAARTLMLDLIDADRPSDRIRATNVAFELEEADPAVIRDLAHLLLNDESNNVRLAALEALRRFSSDPAVADVLLKAVRDNPPEVVRFELIETLVRMNEIRLLPYLEEIIEADTLPQPVRDAAQMASFKLI